ncbi:hypothetical protein LTR10_024038 [Elasticomyces elasticus]|nr:hypothetical protein LTR10_024038 [Elasticomyces elasticus]KAK5021253.1 hypothetical protein LTS07_011168 [Exophiala sideris]KAK5030198.1 hypothetical protein LTR13_008216 [Exophiala sideris]KAK5176428.1 hypothetical protein LTR44_011050 [Eurotiomycetes sp. CCFEE 6388]
MAATSGRYGLDSSPVHKSRHLLALRPSRSNQKRKARRPTQSNVLGEVVQEENHPDGCATIDGTSSNPVKPGSAPESAVTIDPVSTSPTPTLTNLDAAPIREEDQEDPDNAVRAFTPCPEDFGLPPDGLWYHPIAYEQKWWWDRGESEYLLGSRNRWMSSVDFDNPNSTATLERLLQKHKDTGKLESPLKVGQAACDTDLISHVHSVVDRRDHFGRTLYKIQWKACWTPESNIEDKSWIADSLKASSDPTRRRSARVEAGLPQRIKKYQAMMEVVHIEKRLQEIS